jgi:hypothetical protein
MTRYGDIAGLINGLRSPQGSIELHGTLYFPCALVLTVSFALSLVTGLVCHHRGRDAKHRRQLDTSVGASGPHDFAVRITRRSSARRQSVHRIPRPTSVTIAIRPSCRDGMRGMLLLIWGWDQGCRMRQIGTTGKGGDGVPFRRFRKQLSLSSSTNLGASARQFPGR